MSFVPDLPDKCQKDNERKACWERNETQARNLQGNGDIALKRNDNGGVPIVRTVLVDQ